MRKFTDYDRVSDTLMYLNSDTTLEFVMNLSKKTKIGERSFFATEIEFNSDRYLGNTLVSIKRNMNYFFVINIKDNMGGGLLIRPQDKELITMFIENNVIPWLFDKKMSAFQIIKGELVLKEYVPATYAQSDVKYITFEPIIYVYEESKSHGIRMNINGVNIIDMNADKFMGFYSIIKNTDMYGVACNLANYAKTEPYEVNTYKPMGLGASRDGAPNSSAWSEANYNGRGSNSFLNNLK